MVILGNNPVLIAIGCLAYISLAAAKQNEHLLCSIRQDNDDCLSRAVPNIGSMGGWSKQSSLDKYMLEIVTDVGKIMKSKRCDFLGVTNLEVYTQVVAGLNICISTQLTQKHCGKNDAKMCESQTRRCSILVYKPPSKEPVQASNISIFCDKETDTKFLPEM